MRFTRRGRALLALSLAFAAAGYVLAIRDFSVIGVALLVVVAVGAAAVWLRKGTVTVRRRVRPTKTMAGQDVQVELEIRASGRLGWGPILLSDRVPDTLGEEVRLSIDRRRSTRGRFVSYVVRPPVRGRYVLGPLRVLHTDPFGTLQRSEPVPGTASFIVYPSYEPVSTMPTGVQRLGIVRHSPLLGQGDEFYALRQYEDGDDLRKVHWPSSAKLGQVMIRQEELLGEPRLFVVLDTCASKHRGRAQHASIEAAISACASVTMLALERRMRVDVITANGRLLATRKPSDEELLEGLAVLEPSARPDLSAALATVDPRRVGGAAAAVVVTPGLDKRELGLLAGLVSRTSSGAVVHVAAETFDPRPRRRRRPELGHLGLPVLRLEAGASFRRVWETGIRHVAVAR